MDVLGFQTELPRDAKTSLANLLAHKVVQVEVNSVTAFMFMPQPATRELPSCNRPCKAGRHDPTGSQPPAPKTGRGALRLQYPGAGLLQHTSMSLIDQNA